MKIGLMLWVMVLALAIIAPGKMTHAQEAKELSLDEIIDIALAKSPRLAALQRGVEVARRGVNIARGQFFGRADAFGDYLFSGFDVENRRRVGSNIGLMPQLSPTFPPDKQFDNNLFAFGIRYTLPLYTGFRLTAQLDLSRVAALRAEDLVRQASDELIFNLSSTFYTILRIREDIKATEASVKSLEEARRVLEKLVEVGRAAKVDLFKINTRLAAVRQELIRIKNAQEIAYGLLNTLMGTEAVGPRVIPKGILEYIPKKFEIEESVKEALERRPEYQARLKELNIQKENVAIARSQRHPQISLRAQWTEATGDKQGTPFLSDFMAGIVLSMPIFDGRVIRSQVAQEEARLTRLEQEVMALRLDVIREVQEAFLNITEAESRIKTAQVALEEAREALRIEQLKLEVGRGIIEDLLDAQAAALQAERNVFGATADYSISIVALQKAIGAIRP